MRNTLNRTYQKTLALRLFNFLCEPVNSYVYCHRNYLIQRRDGYVMIIKKLSALSVIFIAIALMFAGCQTLPHSPEEHQQTAEQASAAHSTPDAVGATARQPPAVTSAPEAPQPAPLQSVVGTARYYASRFHGRKTASGEVYDQKKMTAAHPTLPFGTLVKVENIANNRSVIVRVNDRCRKHEEVFIDVSREAALELGFIRQGKVDVRLTILDNDPSSEVPAAAKD